MKTFAIVFLVVVLLVMFFFLLKKDASSNDDSYRGKAKLIARFTDEKGCFLCEFEKNGKIINAVYGDDNPDLKVGDEVDVVWSGYYTRLPHAMSKEAFDRSMEFVMQQNDDLL